MLITINNSIPTITNSNDSNKKKDSVTIITILINIPNLCTNIIWNFTGNLPSPVAQRRWRRGRREGREEGERIWIRRREMGIRGKKKKRRRRENG